MNVLFELPLARLTRTPRAWVPVALWTLFAIGTALVLRGSAGDALQAPFGGVALPLLAYALAGATLGGDGLGRSVRSLVSLGAPPARAAFAEIIVTVLAAAIIAPVVGVLVAALAHGPSDPPVLRDAFTTAWISALGGAAYAALFTLGASFGKRGGGRGWFLALDALFGVTDGSGGFLTPRAHVRSLLGGTAVASLSNAASVATLVALTLGFSALALVRGRRPVG